MQFSIFGALFKGMRDTFTWEKIRCTFFVHWAVTWRTLLVGFILARAFVLIYKLLEQKEGFVYFSTVFMHIVLLMLVYYYSKFAVLYNVPFKSFARKFTNQPEKIKFFSWYFWKPSLLSTLFTCVVLIALFATNVRLGGVLMREYAGPKLGLLISLLSAGVVQAQLWFDLLFIYLGSYGFVIAPTEEKYKTSEKSSLPPLRKRIKSSLLFFILSSVLSFFIYACMVIILKFLGLVCDVLFFNMNLEDSLTHKMLKGLSTIVLCCLIAIYVSYDALYKIPYASTERVYKPGDSASKRWSLDFLGMSFLQFLIKLLLAYILGRAAEHYFDGYVLNDAVVYACAYIASAAIIEVAFLAFGTWGFVPVARSAPEKQVGDA